MNGKGTGMTTLSYGLEPKPNPLFGKSYFKTMESFIKYKNLKYKRESF